MAKHLFTSIFKVTSIVVGLLAFKLILSEKTGVQTKGLRGLEGVQQLDWLVIGTSHVDTGYDTRWLTRQSGQRIYTLWYAGLNPMELELILDYTLSRVRVKNLVIDITSGGYSSPPNIWEVDLFWDIPLEQKPLLFSFYLQHYHEVGWGRLLQLLFAHRSAEVLTYPWNAPLVSTLYFMGGRERTKSSITAKKWDKLSPNPRFLMSKGVIRPEYKAALERIFQRVARLEGTRTIALETPMALVTAEHPYLRNIQLELDQLIALHSPRTERIDANTWSEFDRTNSTLFHDDHHLSQQGRTVFSRLFLDKVMGATR
jgi:hypothetical protein